MKLNRENLEWLTKNADAVIRYRAATELLNEPGEKKVELLKNDLMSSSLVRLWLDNLRPIFAKNVMHSGKSEAFENAMGKLYEFGLRKGMKALDIRTKPFRLWLKEQTRLPNKGYYAPFSAFYRTLVAAFLSMTGYSVEDEVDAWVLKRLETVCSFAKKGNLEEVYVPQDTFSGFPNCYRRYPLINPVLYTDDELQLPWIHDLNAFLHSKQIMEDSRLRQKLETIVALILKPEYQKLCPGYGVIRSKSGRYYVMGWSVHLPGYFGSDIPPNSFGHLLLLLKMLGRLHIVREHAWYKRSLSLLESFKGETGLIIFPRDFLPEKAFGYWVAGLRMGLESNRRVQMAITCESTFRYFEIMLKNSEPYA